ncbi:hypothetical protein GCM10023311_25010 [Flaviramulus aquimarinus]|uniref:Methyltransferase type 11 domain-containing protein n=1 Tax=Flaviramulus aquimarinus TaxID=1170456 RepID=A0ABP9FF54_9FLAO
MQHKDLNKVLYSDILFKVWSEKKELLPIEDYLIKKYLLNKKGKVLEAGTGGGRIIFEVEKFGFTTLDAFDYVENMIKFCNEKKKKINSSINFRVADTANLIDYNDNEFDYLIYLQQVLCFMNEDLMTQSLKEAYRIGKNDSTYLFSFLNWNVKFYNPILSCLVNLFRIFRNEKTNKYKLPWLKIGNKFNWKFLNANQPQNIWFKEDRIIKTLRNSGFSIIEIESQLMPKDKVGHLHVICKKAY